MIINIGTYNQLEVVKQLDFGIYLRYENVEILMPSKWVPENTKIGDELNVFVYRDSDDRLIATTIKPYATANTFAYLEVREVNDTGAFLDWGMEKDLLVPFNEQQQRMIANQKYVVFVYVDEKTDRLIASTKLNKFTDNENNNLQEEDVVDLLIYSETKLGFNAIINNRFRGLIYFNEIFGSIKIGDQVRGYVKTIREDNKIDLRLQKSGFELVDEVKYKILNELKLSNGTILISDKSTSEEIKQKFQISKKAYKKAIGALYKERLIVITDTGIKLA